MFLLVFPLLLFFFSTERKASQVFQLFSFVGLESLRSSSCWELIEKVKNSLDTDLYVELRENNKFSSISEKEKTWCCEVYNHSFRSDIITYKFNKLIIQMSRLYIAQLTVSTFCPFVGLIIIIINAPVIHLSFCPVLICVQPHPTLPVRLSHLWNSFICSTLCLSNYYICPSLRLSNSVLIQLFLYPFLNLSILCLSSSLFVQTFFCPTLFSFQTSTCLLNSLFSGLSVYRPI